MQQCYKVSRFTHGGRTVEELMNLPIDKLDYEIKAVNFIADEEHDYLSKN